ncbi:MAG TPA: ribosome silencing factor [Polyangiaceae bacterium]|nr:ribosome silencing factor [Polyangiaceae bacterium]
MATRKRSTGDGDGAANAGDKAARPRIKSSHERVKAVRGAKRAAAPAPRARPKTGSKTGGRTAPSTAVKPIPSGFGSASRGVKKARLHDAPSEEKGIWSIASDAARLTATAVAVAALDKKAMGVEILDVAGKVDYADFLVVMTGRSDRHAQAIAQGIEEELKKKGVRATSVEGLPHGTWVLMDFGDVVVHVFQHDTRQLYDIEGLWLDAARLPVPAELATE